MIPQPCHLLWLFERMQDAASKQSKELRELPGLQSQNSTAAQMRYTTGALVPKCH